MFKLATLFKKPTDSIKAVITSDSFGGFFDVFSTTKKPLSLVPVIASIKIISQSISIADLELYKKTENGRKLLPNHKLTKLFQAPFLDMTYYNWMQMMMLQLAGYGNAYALIIRGVDYNVKELIPLEWDMVTVMKDFNSNTYWYQVTHNSKTFTVFPENMLHYKLFSSDGLEGLSPIALHKATLDSLGAETDYLSSFYDKAANISGTIESTGVNQKQIDSIKGKFESKYGGSANAGKTVILPNGMTYKQLKLLSPMDANYIETAKLNRSDVAVIFGIPLALLGDLSQATFSNITELNRSFYKMTIAPYFKAIADENSMKLLNENEKSSTYFEFNPDILLSAGKKDRYETYAIGIRNGIVTRNEVRELENLETLDGLDEILQESGVMTKKQADEQFANSEVKEDGHIDSDGDIDSTANNSSKSIQETSEVTALMQKQLNDMKAKLGRIETLQTAHNKTPKQKV